MKSSEMLKRTGDLRKSEYSYAVFASATLRASAES